MKIGIDTITGSRALLMVVAAGSMLVSSAQSKSAPTNPCSDIPASVEFIASHDSDKSPIAMWGLSTGQVFLGGAIHPCNTGDFTIVLPSAMWMMFPTVLVEPPLSGGPPPSFLGVAFKVKTFINVRNVLMLPYSNGPRLTATSQAQDFYTGMVVNSIEAPDKQTYGLFMLPEGYAGCPLAGVCVPDLDGIYFSRDLVNPPQFNTSWIRVSFTPATATTYAYWTVDGLTPYPNLSGPYPIGTLILQPKSGGQIHMGQYVMPFQLRIMALGTF
jgi:hypothetical protein